MPPLPVCVVGVVCVSFLVFGLMVAVLFPGAHVWGATGARLPGWMGCRYVAYRDIYFIMGGGDGTSWDWQGWEVCSEAQGPGFASLESKAYGDRPYIST